jgi:predicted kinase
MEAVVLCGIQASGKSTFCRERFFSSHIRLNLDMLKTRHREDVLLRACIEGKQPFVVDNTNPSRADRGRYIAAAKAAGFRVAGYYFESKVSDALVRNGGRPEPQQVPDVAIKGTSARFELPALSEGFDALFYVRLAPGGGFDVQEWRDEV